MRYLKPHYYDKFVCTAGDCPDTCCAGWQIVIDEASLERYGNEKSEFGTRLRNSIDWDEECFYQNNGSSHFRTIPSFGSLTFTNDLQRQLRGGFRSLTLQM